ncbi:hypothetical protein BdWA1_000961 [Babesia duncani]|uniref:Uncharacterized protein n=1 Tax=Babesia duncani TaxID=323732 RepID=A0AAD9PP36_9APIC|nr:hypothetical protein BdWA1_000961 [Babesia duncani]
MHMIENVESFEFTRAFTQNGAKSNPTSSRDEFLGVMKLACGKSDAFMESIDNFKSELLKLSSDSYPFKKSDMHAILNLATQLLCMQNSRQNVGTFGDVVNMFKAENDSICALEFCKIFASKSPTLVQMSTLKLLGRWLYNRIGMLGARYLSHRTMGELNVNYRQGVRQALVHVCDAITFNDLDSLKECCEAKLFKFFKTGMDYLKRINLKLKINTMAIQHVILDKFLITIGGKRNDEIKDFYVFKNFLAHQIIVTPPKSSSGKMLPKTRKENEAMVIEAFKRGVLVRMDVMIGVQQQLALLDDKDDVVLWKDENPVCMHKLSFESNLKIESFDDLSEPGKFDWMLVDVNGVMHNNNPILS